MNLRSILLGIPMGICLGLGLNVATVFTESALYIYFNPPPPVFIQTPQGFQRSSQ